jgi:hypothetical protein
VLANDEGVPLRRASVDVTGELDPASPVRDDVSVFNSVRLAFEISGASEDEALRLVERFKRR